HCERKAELGVADAVIFTNEDEQRREQQHKVVAEGMREADAGDEARLRGPRRGGQGQFGNLGHFLVSCFYFFFSYCFRKLGAPISCPLPSRERAQERTDEHKLGEGVSSSELLAKRPPQFPVAAKPGCPLPRGERAR